MTGIKGRGIKGCKDEAWLTGGGLRVYEGSMGGERWVRGVRMKGVGMKRCRYESWKGGDGSGAWEG